MIGYWNRPDATAETIVDGWLDTGDLVSSRRRRLPLVPRPQEADHHPRRLEHLPAGSRRIALEHPAVESAGVIGVHDLVHGENVRAYVSFGRTSPRPTVAELIQFSRARVGYKAPDEIVVLDEMPINATGKVDRVALKQLAGA